jgi:RsiW-degrading membrane proteinase PrsW (M82 family)
VSDFQPYRPVVPSGLPPERALPVPARPRLRAALAWTAVLVVSGGCALLSVAAITSVTGVLGVLTGTALAAIPVFPVVAAYLWLDRYEAEPASLLAVAFAWGAGVATLGALAVNTASLRAIHDAGGNPTTTVVVVAPIIEEALKGVAVLIVLLVRRREFDGLVDGLVYAGFAGIGFAFVENVLYLGRGFAAGGGTALAAVFVVRCVVSPFAHPLFTGATGIGLGLAARARRAWVRVVAPLAGFAIAVALHAAWNLSALSGLSGFLDVYDLRGIRGARRPGPAPRGPAHRAASRRVRPHGLADPGGGGDAGVAVHPARGAGLGRPDGRGGGAGRDARLPGLRQRAGVPAGADGSWDGCSGRRPAGARAARGPVGPAGSVPADVVGGRAGGRPLRPLSVIA